MWHFTSGGFVSAVQHRDDHSKLMVRARDKQSLTTLVDDIAAATGEARYTYDDVISVEPADYAWRIVVSKADFKLFLNYEVDAFLDYDNFKSELTRTRGKTYHDAAMKVWVAMHDVEDIPHDKGWSQHVKQSEDRDRELFDDPEAEGVFDISSFDVKSKSYDPDWVYPDEPSDKELEELAEMDAELLDELNDTDLAR